MSSNTRLGNVRLEPRHAAVALLAAFAVLAMLLSAGQMAELRVALPRLGGAMNWLEMQPAPFDLDHVVFFALLALPLRLLMPRARWRTLLLGLAVLAVGTELLQFGTAGRTPNPDDARDDMIGAVIGLALGEGLLRLAKLLSALLRRLGDGCRRGWEGARTACETLLPTRASSG